MHVFVTGGSGFVGGRVVRRLLGAGHRVSVLCRSSDAARKVSREGATPVQGDLTDLSGGGAPWVDVLAEVDAVVHLAARMEFWGNDAVFREANHRPTLALYRASAEQGVDRFVYVSAAAVSTGTQREAVVDEATADGSPNTAYGRVKLATERALWESDLPMDLVVLRPPFVWGAGMATIDGFREAIDAGRFAWIDQGRHTVDFVHVENLAMAIELAATPGGAVGTFYVTDGTPMSVRAFFTELFEAHGIAVPERSVPGALARPMASAMELGARALRARTAPPLTTWITAFMGRSRSYDIARARDALAYSPAVSLEEGMSEIREVAVRRPVA